MHPLLAAGLFFFPISLVLLLRWLPGAIMRSRRRHLIWLWRRHSNKHCWMDDCRVCDDYHEKIARVTINPEPPRAIARETNGKA